MAVDFSLDDNFRMIVKEGDFATGTSEPTEARLILLAAKGDWKQWPITGVNLREYLASPVGPVEQVTLMREIRVQLELDNKKDFSFQTAPDGNFSILLK